MDEYDILDAENVEEQNKIREAINQKDWNLVEELVSDRDADFPIYDEDLDRCHIIPKILYDLIENLELYHRIQFELDNDNPKKNSIGAQFIPVLTYFLDFSETDYDFCEVSNRTIRRLGRLFFQIGRDVFPELYQIYLRIKTARINTYLEDAFYVDNEDERVELVRKFIRRGGNPNAKCKSPHQPYLFKACEAGEGNFSILPMLLNHGADININDDGFNLLNLLLNRLSDNLREHLHIVNEGEDWIDVDVECVDMIEYILDRGADFTTIDYEIISDLTRQVEELSEHFGENGNLERCKNLINSLGPVSNVLYCLQHREIDIDASSIWILSCTL